MDRARGEGSDAMIPVAQKMERMRRQWFDNVDMRPKLLEKALAVLEGKLEAKETKFFSFQGMVIEEKEVEAHGIQLEAATAIAKLADAFPKERSDVKATPQFALEIKDGVFRLVIGGSDNSSREGDADEVTKLQLTADAGDPALVDNALSQRQAQDSANGEGAELVTREQSLRTLRGED